VDGTEELCQKIQLEGLRLIFSKMIVTTGLLIVIMLIVYCAF